jgi:hypothetical protein
MAAADFQSRHLAILEGERQVAEKLPQILTEGILIDAMSRI